MRRINWEKWASILGIAITAITLVAATSTAFNKIDDHEKRLERSEAKQDKYTTHEMQTNFRLMQIEEHMGIKHKPMPVDSDD